MNYADGAAIFEALTGLTVLALIVYVLTLPFRVADDVRRMRENSDSKQNHK